MRRLLLSAACVAALAAAGCSDWLSGPELTENPNRPSVSSADQLFVGVQVQTIATFTGRFPMQLLPMYVRQFAGVARQWQGYATFENGGPSENDADQAFIDTYAHGGLVDIRAIQDAARAADNKKFLGIAQVYEALRIGTAAALFGDIPYSQALGEGGARRELDPQRDVLGEMLVLLDSAIANLESGVGNGPASLDFAFANDAEKWVRAAHTLKARYLLYLSRAPDSLARYADAAEEAAQGIRDPADDWVARFTTTAGEQNLYYNFLNSRSGDIEPDAFYINLLRARNDPLLEERFSPRTGGSCSGAYIGSGQGSTSGACVSSFDITQTTPVSILTAAENETILAEAQDRLGQAAAALGTLNTLRDALGYDDVAPTGVNVLLPILQERHVHLHLSPQVYFDYLRTCYPNFEIGYMDVSHQYVPARFPYGYSERIANPAIPAYGEQGNDDRTNALFPKNTRDPAGVACHGQEDR